jgi:hypothetical protein
MERTNHNAYLTLTPTEAHGGSANPPAAPGAAPAAAAPAVPFAAAAFAPRRVTSNIPNQALRAALTTQGSIMEKYPDPPAPAPAGFAVPVNAAFDNFFYGGERLTHETHVVAMAGGNYASARVVDVPSQIVQPGLVAGAGQLDLSTIHAHYLGRGTKHAGEPAAAPLAGGALPLTVNARWIGARLLSDHLPVILEFDCP